jgi:hypothetical protein
LGSQPKDNEVYFNFGDFFPMGIASYRGYYDQLALGYFSDTESLNKPKLVSDWLNDLTLCIGKQFGGYKGGSYTMDKDTPIWVSNWGQATGTTVIGVQSTNWGRTIILTGYGE